MTDWALAVVTQFSDAIIAGLPTTLALAVVLTILVWIVAYAIR